MAKARLTRKDGTKVMIEGTPEEVSKIVAQIGGEPITDEESVTRAPRAKSRLKQKTTPMNLVASLIDGGFFRKPKDLAAVRVALQEMGHVYPVTTLSPVLLRLVRRRQIRRIKEKHRWLYTG